MNRQGGFPPACSGGLRRSRRFAYPPACGERRAASSPRVSVAHQIRLNSSITVVLLRRIREPWRETLKQLARVDKSTRTVHRFPGTNASRRISEPRFSSTTVIESAEEPSRLRLPIRHGQTPGWNVDHRASLAVIPGKQSCGRPDGQYWKPGTFVTVADRTRMPDGRRRPSSGPSRQFAALRGR